MLSIVRNGVAVVAVCVACAWSASGQSSNYAVPEETRAQCVAVLRQTLHDEAQWVKVHAAEHLLALGYPQDVRDIFLKELAQHGTEPQYRIGIWRVLARVAETDADRAEWVAKIRAAFEDEAGPDRTHAAETLSKLGEAIGAEDRGPYRAAAESDDGPLSTFSMCILIHSGEAEWHEDLAGLLSSADERTRQCAAYALRHAGPLPPAIHAKILSAAAQEDHAALPYAFLIGAAVATADAETDIGAQDEELRRLATSGDKTQQYEAISVLAIRGEKADLPLLQTLLDHPEADIRQAAAYAMLRVDRRSAHYLHTLDWVVIAAYAIMLLSVGFYYSRETKTAEDYLLGGRQMRPLIVGLSMFATLLSTLTYLAIPGEMIKHGPMILSQYTIYPVSFLVIGFVLVPAIMKSRVTSAYEILEERLGLSVRMMGSCFFLAMRFMWMGLIIYATSSKVLVPLLQWSQDTVPYVCIVMGVITVVYTSMGGIKAVVITDAVQTGILFGGAFLTLAVITVKMGGVSAWFPQTWSPNWDPFRFTYDPTARLTVMGAVTSSFVWYTCTAGSDQVAIQRYLATRDARSARRVVATSLFTDVMTGSFLGLLGLALWSYFQSHPYMLPDAYQSMRSADTLFPRFIALGLPAGVSGLVVAGLLAAAMSSLSSGVNSASSVITVDFLNRFRRVDKRTSGFQALRETKVVSVFVGIAVILLSIVVGAVSGNLLEMVYKIVNLLVAPLFVLFVMALFVPWATAPGAVIAGACSVAMAVGIAYFELFGLQFIWIMPMALLTGVVVGPIASLLPFGRRRA